MCAQIMQVVAPRGCVDSVRLRESALKVGSGKRVISCCAGKSNFEQEQSGRHQNWVGFRIAQLIRVLDQCTRCNTQISWKGLVKYCEGGKNVLNN